MNSPRLFSSARAYDPGDGDDTRFIEFDGSDVGEETPPPKKQRALTKDNVRYHRAQQEIRRMECDFSALLKHWGRK